jgi:hypothetical protein
VFEPRVRAFAARDSRHAGVLAERVGWTRSIRWFTDNVKRLRTEHRPLDPADWLTWAPGDAAQCDLWLPPRKIPLEDGTTKLLPVLVITAAHSRFMTGRMIPTRKRANARVRALARFWDHHGRVRREQQPLTRRRRPSARSRNCFRAGSSRTLAMAS